ncbi:DUF6804 family protein [Winogradskyella eximia]|uniref:DUF6804 family protein n=1 Tax=Winogradskyella eximia TaxID=262006 RepID=UPI002490B35A|nr:DUF6804 family protein [Winogradskyella eximia]
MKKIIVFIKIILSILFLSCLLDWNYGYYELVRFLGMIGFGILAYRERKNKTWLIFFIASAILINPLFKIALGRLLWNVIDVIWAIILLGSIGDYKEILEHNIKGVGLFLLCLLPLTFIAYIWHFFTS